MLLVQLLPSFLEQGLRCVFGNKAEIASVIICHPCSRISEKVRCKAKADRA
jgi:hypothetical protein